MRTIGAAKFKEQCLAVLDQLDPDGVVITKHGQPVAKLIPWGRAASTMIGSMKGRIEIRGDILSTGEPWDAES